MNSSDRIKECKKWYSENKVVYEGCGETVKRLIAILLKQNGLPYHSIDSRIKNEDSFINKCQKGKYDDPTSQITDVCGLRIITYTNHDVKNIQKIIESEFVIDDTNSVDKSKVMKDDQVGYLSVHYVATLKNERTSLTEYKIYKDIKFEIQIRTLLQHAWAEIEHDRNYKFSGELPSEIKRRFYLIAGSLELLDREFEQLSLDIDTYAENVRAETQNGNYEEKINSTSLLEYLSVKLENYDIKNRHFNEHDKEIIFELSAFGIETLKDLDNYLTDEMIENLSFSFDYGNYLGMLRHMMMITDADKYFNEVWQRDWCAINPEAYKIISNINPDIKKYKDNLSIDDHRL